MKAPKRGRVFALNDGTQWCVGEVTTADDLDDPEVDAEFFLVTVVEGTDPDSIYGDSLELTSDEFLAWCEEHQVNL